MLTTTHMQRLLWVMTSCQHFYEFLSLAVSTEEVGQLADTNELSQSILSNWAGQIIIIRDFEK